MLYSLALDRHSTDVAAEKKQHYLLKSECLDHDGHFHFDAERSLGPLTPDAKATLFQILERRVKAFHDALGRDNQPVRWNVSDLYEIIEIHAAYVALSKTKPLDPREEVVFSWLGSHLYDSIPESVKKLRAKLTEESTISERADQYGVKPEDRLHWLLERRQEITTVRLALLQLLYHEIESFQDSRVRPEREVALVDLIQLLRTFNGNSEVALMSHEQFVERIQKNLWLMDWNWERFFGPRAASTPKYGPRQELLKNIGRSWIKYVERWRESHHLTDLEDEEIGKLFEQVTFEVDRHSVAPAVGWTSNSDEDIKSEALGKIVDLALQRHTLMSRYTNHLSPKDHLATLLQKSPSTLDDTELHTLEQVLKDIEAPNADESPAPKIISGLPLPSRQRQNTRHRLGLVMAGIVALGSAAGIAHFNGKVNQEPQDSRVQAEAVQASHSVKSIIENVEPTTAPNLNPTVEMEVTVLAPALEQKPEVAVSTPITDSAPTPSLEKSSEPNYEFATLWQAAKTLYPEDLLVAKNMAVSQFADDVDVRVSAQRAMKALPTGYSRIQYEYGQAAPAKNLGEALDWIEARFGHDLRDQVAGELVFMGMTINPDRDYQKDAANFLVSKKAQDLVLAEVTRLSTKMIESPQLFTPTPAPNMGYLPDDARDLPEPAYVRPWSEEATVDTRGATELEAHYQPLTGLMDFIPQERIIQTQEGSHKPTGNTEINETDPIIVEKPSLEQRAKGWLSGIRKKAQSFFR